MSAIWTYTTGPQLHYQYKAGTRPGAAYIENRAEFISSRTIACLRASWNMCYFFSPILLVMLYRRGMFHGTDGPPYLAKVVAVSVAVYYAAHVSRGFGRMSNSAYRAFSSELRQVRAGRLPNRTLAKYDFEFSHWPVNYSLKNNRSRPVTQVRHPENGQLGLLEKLKLFPLQVLSYLVAHSFGRWMIYPGSTDLLNAMIEPSLVSGRTRLVESHNGQRNKLETYEGNHIDTMFIDKRHEGTDNGNILVIVSEGNAAFYEAGCLDCPLQRGYSILGWNHPGFGSSTGKPHPDQEHNGIDTVVQFAINELNFTIHQIIFFSWSIGGFASTWAAANYPDCKALILDATFDDLMPLAKNRMPAFLEGVVEITIREHFDLNIASWLNKYDGPVKLIRRTQDEMISLNPADVRTNRGNYLLTSMLRHRYPKIFNSEASSVVTRWLSYTENRKDTFMSENNVDEDVCYLTLQDLSKEQDVPIPLLKGEDLDQTVKNQLALYLADKHLDDVISTHCVPLPPDMFELPWQLE